MTSQYVLFRKVAYRYESMPEPLFQGISASFAAGWTGIVGANGSGKTTVLKLSTGLLEPTEGRINLPGNAVYCAQRTDAAPGRLGSLIEATDPVAAKIKQRMGIGSDWEIRWSSLSHGERKRAQIAAALWQNPAVLALDEPTNHIDCDARAILEGALSDYNGIGLLVSHDRELLDRLCRNCFFLKPPDAVLRPGNYSSGRQQAIREEEYARYRRKVADQNVARLKVESQRRMSHARTQARKHSKQGLARKDHDRRARIDLARLTGADGRAGSMARKMRARFEEARKVAEEIQVAKRYRMGIWIEGERCRRDTLFQLCAGAIPLGSARTLHYPDLTMMPGDRIALTGANGTGKSTLIQRIVNSVPLQPERLTYMPQEIDLQSSCKILEDVKRQPPEILGRIMTVIRRLGSRPAGLLESVEPSPGEVRKLLLALGIAAHPHLIIMDEPTNHLDLPSIECLEDALAECPCGLLLVSHDTLFLRRLTGKRWHITRTSAGNGEHVTVQVL